MLPDYWLPRPAYALTAENRAAFDGLLEQARKDGPRTEINYHLEAPKWQFLSYASEQLGLAMHGSGNDRIEVFEPRQPYDLNDFGNQKAVYAAGDGIWAMFYAVVDRERYKMWINNACARLVAKSGETSGPYYVFSVSQQVLALKPWRSGVVYLLPMDTFIEQPPIPYGEFEARIPQLASLEPVIPLAKLRVEPADFPFLSQVRGLDDARIEEYGRAMQTGGPWPDAD